MSILAGALDLGRVGECVVGRSRVMADDRLAVMIAGLIDGARFVFPVMLPENARRPPIGVACTLVDPVVTIDNDRLPVLLVEADGLRGADHEPGRRSAPKAVALPIRSTGARVLEVAPLIEDGYQRIDADGPVWSTTIGWPDGASPLVDDIGQVNEIPARWCSPTVPDIGTEAPGLMVRRWHRYGRCGHIWWAR